MKTLISFDLRADMGFFKKPDVNESLYLTYNMLHKPCLLGILGAICGYRGFERNGVWPEYYVKLKDLEVSIEPLDRFHEKGNFTKTVIAYNNSVGYASQEEGGNLIIKEQTLIRPAFRCYLLLDEEIKDHQRMKERLLYSQCDFIPYLGKNEYIAWWENPQTYGFEEFGFDRPFTIRSLFVKEFVAKDHIIKSVAAFGDVGVNIADRFMYFERLPIRYHETLYQYELAEFVYTNWSLKQESKISNLYVLEGTDGIIQLY